MLGLAIPQEGVWKHFHQCARISSGDPYLCCLTCHNVYVHPKRHHSGTSSVGNHVKKCLKDTEAVRDALNSEAQVEVSRIIYFVAHLLL